MNVNNSTEYEIITLFNVYGHALCMGKGDEKVASTHSLVLFGFILHLRYAINQVGPFYCCSIGWF